MNWMWCRAFAPAAALVAVLAQSVQAQQQQPAQPAAQPNPVCSRLETQLQTFDRSSGDTGRAEQIRKFEDAATSQQAEIDRQETAARKAGCEANSFFVLFSGQQAQCGPLNSKIKQMRDNLDRIQSDIERMRGDGGPERDTQRRGIVVALAQNNCGAQYQQQAAATAAPQQSRAGGFLDTLFGSRSAGPPGIPEIPGVSGPSGTFRTICVRTCDGFYFPVSQATSSARFAEDEKACRQSCPAAEVQLYSHRNPGEGINEAVSVVNQQPYTALPNAFRYRTALDQTCSCRRPGETWSQALKNIEDGTVEQGDIVVNDQRAKQLSQPRVDAQGRPIRTAPTPAATTPAARPDTKAVQAAPLPPAQAAASAPAAANQPAATGSTDDGPSKPDPNRKVRAVGPTFLPAR